MYKPSLLTRKGAPFYSRFLQLMNCLDDSGLMNYWTEEAISRRVRDNRAVISSGTTAPKDDDKVIRTVFFFLPGLILPKYGGVCANPTYRWLKILVI